MKSTISEAEVRSRLDDVRSYLYANRRDGENSATACLLSKTVHSFTHETRVMRSIKMCRQLFGIICGRLFYDHCTLCLPRFYFSEGAVPVYFVDFHV